jgi:hypothetical protein
MLETESDSPRVHAMAALYFHMLAYLALRLRDPLRIIAGVMLIVALVTLFAAHRYQHRLRPAGKIIPFPQRRQREQRRAA